MTACENRTARTTHGHLVRYEPVDGERVLAVRADERIRADAAVDVGLTAVDARRTVLTERRRAHARRTHATREARRTAARERVDAIVARAAVHARHRRAL